MVECGQKSCEATATDRMFWPGNPPISVCEPCKQKALGIARAMGFFLHTEPINDVSSVCEAERDQG
jgi:hypothetical protein